MEDIPTKKCYNTSRRRRSWGICQGDNRLKLQTLELHHANLTLNTVVDLLFSNRNSLHTFHTAGCKIIDGGKWRRVFKDMVGNFPQLRNVRVDSPREYENGELTRVPLPRLTEYRLVPGSTKYVPPTWKLRMEKRRLDTLQHPIQINYYHRVMKIVMHMVSYSGPDIDQFLLVLADEAQSQ